MLIEDEVVSLAGEQGVMHDTPLLIALGDSVTTRDGRFEILGHARYSYGRGLWDEFWALDKTGQSVWISVDEGDVVVQREVVAKDVKALTMRPGLGEPITYRKDRYIVTEREDAECVALRGSFDHVLTVGDRYAFVNASGPGAQLLSGEIREDGAQWYLGQWYSPFDIQVERVS